MSQRRFVFLDRDGTIIAEKEYLSAPRQVELLPQAAAGLRRLRLLGLGLVVVTNQSGIGRGYFDAAALERIHSRMIDLLQGEGVRLDGIYTCPHLPSDDCPCRKPRPGLVQQAATDLGFEPATSFVIGDKPCDIELGRQVGATTFLVRTGYGAHYAVDPSVKADHIVNSLDHAANVIERLLADSQNCLRKIVVSTR